MKIKLFKMGIAALTVICFSCKPASLLEDIDLTPPESNHENTVESEWGAPQNLIAESGDLDNIPLSWTPVKNAVLYQIFYADSPGEFTERPSAEKKAEKTDIEEGKVSWKLCGSEASPLPAGSIYYFKVRAVDKSGKLSPETPAVPAALLDVPEAGQPEIEQGKITLRWHMPNLGTEGIEYVPQFIVQGFSGSEEFKTLCSEKEIEKNENIYSFHHIDLEPVTKYTYRISAFIEKDKGYRHSPDFAIKTPVQHHPNRLPSFTASCGTFCDGIKLEWEAPEPLKGHETEPVAYTIYRSCPPGEETVLIENTSGIDSFTDLSIDENKKYNYRIVTRFEQTSEGKTLYSEEGESCEATGFRLWVPTDLKTVCKEEGIELSWSYPDNLLNKTVFKITRETDDIGGEITEIASAYNGTSFSDNSVKSGNRYHYSIRAVCNEADSTEVSAPLRTENSINWKAETSTDWFKDYTASEGNKSEITLNWQSVSGVSYSIYRNSTGYGYREEDLIAEALTLPDGGSICYSDSDLGPGEYFYYRLRGICDDGVILSEPVKGYTLGIPTKLSASRGEYSDKINIEWNNAKGADGYRIYYKTNNDEEFTGGPEITGGDSYTYDFVPPDNNDPNLRGLPWIFSISSLRNSSDGNTIESDLSNDTTGMTLGPALADLTAGQAEFNDRIRLCWNAVPGAESYDIYRGTSSDPSLATRIIEKTENTETEDCDTDEIINHDKLYYFIRPFRSGTSSTLLSLAAEGWALIPPREITASEGTSATDITLTWSAVKDAVKYDIYKNDRGNWLRIGINITSTEYSCPLPEENLDAGRVEAQFMLRSIGKDGLVSLDSTKEVTGYALSKPVNVSASNGDLKLCDDGRYYTRIFWPEVAGANKYQVERLDDRDSSWRLIAEVPANEASVAEYHDFDAIILKGYKQSYRLKTIGNTVETGYSEIIKGYRQISHEEFLNIVLYSIRSSINRGLFKTTATGSEKKVDGLLDGYGKTDTFVIGEDRRSFSYSGYRDYFISIDGSYHQGEAWCAAGGEHTGTYKHIDGDTAVLTIQGPAETGLYSGTIQFNGVVIPNNDGNNPGWNDGTIGVFYGGTQKEIDCNSAVPFSLFMDDQTLMSELEADR